jgi:hypothetical protein
LISDAPKVGRITIYKLERVYNMLVPASMVRFETIHKIEWEAYGCITRCDRKGE